ncbi:hypothetical protein DPMN_083932 [Dreissena polymorpha]|uniref:Uncharacterized protein n=1 Tax=Dreissena polymorpha TaxID=45954 RepID=A0A9D3YDN4_DREPO|nr:hypothetical protein DPMN_083932 [Dreissena polymorpha]
MQTTVLVDGSAEAGLEAYVEAEHYHLASIHQVYELMFETLDDDFCRRPSLSATGSAVTVTERVVRRREPDRISKATSRVDLRLPIGSTTMSVSESLESTNNPSPSPWKAPKNLAEPKPLEGGKKVPGTRPDHRFGPIQMAGSGS